ncbi:prepilin-type N-terminal cleavage/methylation domain-containing protein [Planomicrobium sp. CPCC 101079]|uniref:prepilin-type N-terminal cleavage/methylation domain-containing protein n=1 Tax=Planomicrobium sp. CPCC 101079 TaxID=2599618 RepID=UPI0011B53BB9|nr:prepilin-type N-terminal cleavage/methylation domain-containing protein [Planomicrobium sp. CPCC 101079]TWT09015.1 prepilin-type N-terminal cleavage/methylation domain-containing protein [Planomicrobium sp. CPCC 101079]
MKKFIQNKLKDQKGMTLIELLAVIVIIAIIAAIAIPAIGNIIENSRYSAVKSDATNVLNAAQLYYTENPQGPQPTGQNVTAPDLTVAMLKTEGFLESEGEIPTTATITRGTGTDNALQLTTSAIKYSGSKTLTFSNATVKQINDDNRKGSSNDNKEI